LPSSFYGRLVIKSTDSGIRTLNGLQKSNFYKSGDHYKDMYFPQAHADAQDLSAPFGHHSAWRFIRMDRTSDYSKRLVVSCGARD